MIDNFILGFHALMSWQVLFFIPFGVAYGIIAGALPGITGAVGIALVLPFTFGMETVASFAFLVSIYCGAEYGGSITAITINTPGTLPAAATALDGYALTQKGEPGLALGTSIVASTTGGIISTFFLILLSVPLANFALRFGPAEFFALGIFGMTLIASLCSESMIKGFVAAAFGLVLCSIGIDAFTGIERFTFGLPELGLGLSFIPILIGLFAISEVLMLVEKTFIIQKISEKVSSKLPSWKQLKSISPIIFLGSLIGTIIGAIPGTGGAVACWISLNEAKRFSKHPTKFGTGIIEGVAAPESANNATVGGALIPLLALGVPGSGSTAVILGAFMLHGLVIGPRIFVTNPEVIYAIFISLFLANLCMLAMGLIGTKLWARIIQVPINILVPIIVILCFTGAYSISGTLFDVWIMIIFGVFGYIIRKLRFSIVPIVLAVVLGEMIESNLRRALLIAGGSWFTFFEKPISLVFLIFAVISFSVPVYRSLRHRKKSF